MTLESRKRDETAAAVSRPAAPKRRYDKPRLIDYGLVSKLTQTGGSKAGDGKGGMQVCL